ncbi:AAA family ATPase [Bradyrhizobium sp. URHD0069]|uniref:AAA family ATPase n=1 Tax=Bradyrhizobium sp. URHD0069 TaxID=1380355 RepID=UPI00068A7DDD|nr:AAA family ATPase [Bradyrhizobium sp. URHD0069]
MSDAPYFIQMLGLSGFRAFLQPKTFDFSNKRCLAIFAPNGSGKSSVIDALEFMFSKDGTLDRLGIRTTNNNAGFVALAHNLAEDAKLAPSVSIDFIAGQTVTSGSRLASGPKRPMPPSAMAVDDCLTVTPIIRGHVLRAFVENHTPEQRYGDVANWLQLGPLVEVQKNLRALRSQIKAAAEDLTAQQGVERQLAKETVNAVPAWEDQDVLTHANSFILAPLDITLAFKALSVTDPMYVELTNRVIKEEHQVGLVGLQQIRQAAAALWNEFPRGGSDEAIVAGAIPDFETAAARLSKAIKVEADERGKAASAAFQALWKAAEPVFAEGSSSVEECPICTTPIKETKAESVDGIRGHIVKHLAELADYAAAKSALDDTNTSLNKAHDRLVIALVGLAHLLGDEKDLSARLGSYRAAIEAWATGAPPASADCVEAIAALLARLDTKIAGIETRQGNHTYTKAKSKLDRLIELKAERLLAIRTQEELAKLSDELTAQGATISGEIRKKVQVLLDKLQKPMNDIYKVIQGTGATPIRLELPAEDDINQQRLHLVIDFAKNRTGVAPGGYLSDSQIHSVALALRLAAIKRFNRSAPIIALDDVVTSYDADHRRTIAGLLAATFSDCQILVTTHDERFFNYLKDQLEAKDWLFTRIIGLDPAYGPRFADHKVTDDMIEARWTDGELAANEIRQAEEEWLLGICRDFGVSVRIRPLEKAYSYERSELASALASVLRDAKLNPQLVAGVNNRFLDSLQKGEIENFGSHFQDGPYGDGSIGDERARWNEFKAFRGQFACPKCKRTKFKRPFTLKKPVCAHAACEAQFDFVRTPVAGTAAGGDPKLRVI